MIELMKQAIDVLKSRISANLEEIRHNESRFRKIMSSGDLDENSVHMNSILELNKQLLSQNFDFLNLQLSLLKFLEKYPKHHNDLNNLSLEEVDKVHETLDMFFYTTQGSLPFNTFHPFVYDEYFWGELMNHYESKEKPEEAKKVVTALMMSKLN